MDRVCYNLVVGVEGEVIIVFRIWRVIYFFKEIIYLLILLINIVICFVLWIILGFGDKIYL